MVITVVGQKVEMMARRARYPGGVAVVGAAIAGLVMAAVPTGEAIAATNAYERCTANLIGLKVSAEDAAATCAKALHPQDVATCVETVQGKGIALADALASCNNVRRPLELGTCVTAIRDKAGTATAMDVLGNCRRSLLPERYGSCVVGLHTAAKLPAAKAMDTCIDAGYYPKELHETFIPFAADGSIAPTSTSPMSTSPGGFTGTTTPPTMLMPTPAPSGAPVPALF
jgi:hypothetical protein